MNPPYRCSVLVPSFGRPHFLRACLGSLAAQTRRPDEVLVIWQADDEPTQVAAEEMRKEMPFELRVLHSPEPGVVPAENTALGAATGDIVLLIDDDAVAPPEWIARHLAHYHDPMIGAVGGPADNVAQDGTPFPRRSVEPVGRLTWYGKPLGNMYDQAVTWRNRPATPVDHLVGYNMSLRRSAFRRFEPGLRRYWQSFEMEACLQVRARGYQVLFDFGNVVTHYPTNTAYGGGRDGDLTVKVYNGAFNLAYVLAKHSRPHLWPIRLLFLLLVGSVGAPGLAASFLAMKRYGRPFRELGVLGRTWRSVVTGWAAGTRRRWEAGQPQGLPAYRVGGSRTTI